MKILSIPTFSNAVQYYRHTVPNAGLRRAGHHVDQHFLEEISGDDGTKFPQWLEDNVKGYDIIHTGYMATEAAVAVMTAVRNFANIPFITDIDDDIYNVPVYNPAFVHYHAATEVRRIVRMHLRVSDAVTVSTDPLNAVLARDCSNIATLPNLVDPHDWAAPIKRRTNSTQPCIMFAGNLGRLGDLNAIRGGIESLMRSRDDLILVFMGCVPDWVNNNWMPSTTDPTRNRAFVISPSPVSTYRHILNHISPDIFINPIECNTFNKSKSHIKAFDAAMCGAAFVCTDWDTHAAIPDECALKIDNTTTQWRDTLDAVLSDRPLRDRLNTRLTQWIMDTQTIDKHADKWVNLYSDTIARGPITSLDQIVRPRVGGADGMERQSKDSPQHSREASAEGGAPVRLQSASRH